MDRHYWSHHTHQQFAAFLDAYEREHFGFDEGALAVSEATLNLMATFGPNRFAPRAAVTWFAKGLMDAPLLDAFRYRRPSRWERSLATGALRLRGRVARFLPPLKEPLFARQLPNIRSYPDGYDVDKLGTFPVRTGRAEGWLRTSAIPCFVCGFGCHSGGSGPRS